MGPERKLYQKLKKNRNCKVFNKAISNSVKKVEFLEVVEGLTQMSGINNENFTTTKIIKNNLS